MCNKVYLQILFSKIKSFKVVVTSQNTPRFYLRNRYYLIFQAYCKNSRVLKLFYYRVIHPQSLVFTSHHGEKVVSLLTSSESPTCSLVARLMMKALFQWITRVVNIYFSNEQFDHAAGCLHFVASARGVFKFIRLNAFEFSC